MMNRLARTNSTTITDSAQTFGYGSVAPPQSNVRSGTTRMQGEQNYPNPLTSVNDFRTTIPFEIATSSEAKIAFFDETGRVIHSETTSFEGAGKHFFFFTGKDLSAGTYWYTIESPIGAVIVKRTMLVIK